MKRLIISTSLCLLSLHSLATAPRWYEVNILIFTNSGVSEDSPESWPTYPLLKIPENVIHISQPAEDDRIQNADDTIVTSNKQAPDNASATDTHMPQPFVALPDDQKYLKNYADRLAADRHYTVLYHESWFHPILPENEAEPVEIIGGNTYGSINELHGLIKIHISRYLHVETDLYLTDVTLSDSPFDLITGASDESTLSASSLEDQLEPFGGLGLFTDTTGNKVSPVTGKNNQYYVATSSAHMDMKRRMRSKELYYFDNPKFGMLIYFIPIEDLQQDKTETSPQ